MFVPRSTARHVWVRGVFLIILVRVHSCPGGERTERHRHGGGAVLAWPQWARPCPSGALRASAGEPLLARAVVSSAHTVSFEVDLG